MNLEYLCQHVLDEGEALRSDLEVLSYSNKFISHSYCSVWKEGKFCDIGRGNEKHLDSFKVICLDSMDKSAHQFLVVHTDQ